MILFWYSMRQNHRKAKPVVEIVGFLEQQNCNKCGELGWE